MGHVKEFLDHKKDGLAVHANDGFMDVNGKRKPRRTTKGWKMCASMADGSTQWIDLSLAKEAYPVQVAEYAVANKIVHEPAFSWWVPYALRKRERILKAVKRKAIARKTEKFGIEVPRPTDVKQALQIDNENPYCTRSRAW